MKDIKVFLKKKMKKGEKRSETDIKTFLKKKKKRQYHRERNKSLCEKQKQKQVDVYEKLLFNT